ATVSRRTREVAYHGSFRSPKVAEDAPQPQPSQEEGARAASGRAGARGAPGRGEEVRATATSRGSWWRTARRGAALLGGAAAAVPRTDLGRRRRAVHARAASRACARFPKVA